MKLTSRLKLIAAWRDPGLVSSLHICKAFSSKKLKFILHYDNMVFESGFAVANVIHHHGDLPLRGSSLSQGSAPSVCTALQSQLVDAVGDTNDNVSVTVVHGELC